MTEINNQPPPAATGRVGGHAQVAGYVPSAEGVKAGARRLAQSHSVTAALGDVEPWQRYAYEVEQVLSAAVPIEVARVLGPLQELVDAAENLPTIWGNLVMDTDEDQALLLRAVNVTEAAVNHLRAVLDAVGVPAQVDEAATGGQSEVQVDRLDRYNIEVGGFQVRADAQIESRIRAMDNEARRRFLRVMGKTS